MPEPDFATALTKCYFCGEDSTIVMNSIGTKEKADRIRESHGKVASMIPCSTCEDWMSEGIMLIGIDLKKSPEGWETRDRFPNPYRSGNLWVVTEEAFKNVISSQEVLKEGLEKRWLFIDIEIAKSIGLE